MTKSQAGAGLTDLEYWEQYWDSYEPRRFDRHKIDELTDELPNDLRALEIGGFPGQISAYLRMKKNFDVSIVDFHIEPGLVQRTESVFALEPGSIKTHKADFFAHEIDETYDLVHSHGFIEHFDETRDVLARHLALVREGGYLLVTLPNLRNSLYGWMVKRYDYPLFKTHKLEAMDPEFLAQCCRDLGVREVKIRFIGAPDFWLPDNKVPALHRPGLRLLKAILGSVFGGVRNQTLSPSIAILVRK